MLRQPRWCGGTNAGLNFSGLSLRGLNAPPAQHCTSLSSKEIGLRWRRNNSAESLRCC